MIHLAAALMLGTIANPGISVADVDGVPRRPLQVAKGEQAVLFFITHDCPISNAYALEINRICAEYGPRGVRCALVYVDPTLSDADARAHAKEYGHGGYVKLVDRKHELVKATGATVTPEAVVVAPAPGGKIVYRGRLDDSFAALGQSRQMVTQPDLRNAIEAALSGKPAPKDETRALGCYIPDLNVFSH